MSRLIELKEQVIAQTLEIVDRIKESEAYNQLYEKYTSLNSSGQRLVQIGSISVLLFALLYSPLSQVELSQTLLGEFQEKRNLIRDLFKTYRESSALVQITRPPQSFEITGQIQSMLTTARLIPEQIVSVADGVAIGKLIPDKITESIIEVKLAKLNLSQIVEIGTRLINISNAIKIKDMSIKAISEMPGYFNVNYTLYALKVPEPIIETPDPIEEKPSKKKKNKSSDEKAESED